ncbi:hypothetical protein Q8W98_12265 [Pseudomonas aeruginosa]|uniref:hypothetical protein n=1 Tax=Pseudomonas aeruginosa TaxID=287 RepID=UPI0029019B79|nr:hypothetical protein [Pseudomonas aeruginosa]MDU0688832.1 hypothetical protein [Pseudomonas aeruginosa]
MTDHAELRRLAGLASGGNWYGEDSQVLVGKHAIAYCNHKVDAQFIGEANPKTILALLDEIDGMKASGWRNHSVNYARAEKCPQTLETAQAAWDRDQELIEEQRQQIARDSQTINQLRQKLQSAEVDRDRLKAENCAHKDKQKHCECLAQDLKECASALPGTYYMDPPDGGNVSIPEQIRRMAKDAARYRWLRERDLETIRQGGVFAGMTPENIVLNLEHLDAAIDAALEGATQ